MNRKYTREQAEECEAIKLIEALGNCLELNESFLEAYCNQEMRNLLLKVEEHEREFILSSADLEAYWFNGSPTCKNDQHIWLNISEIEVQFEGKPEDYFSNIDDWCIDGSFAYLYVGYGLSVDFNIEQIKTAVEIALKAQ
ncbi:MAG: hypothetical protein GY755_15580 [Chloroflexi bacterium]|nr:hypothetical protein [Chloroflexota bacterium]